jgi:hypothetical protein
MSGHVIYMKARGCAAEKTHDPSEAAAMGQIAQAHVNLVYSIAAWHDPAPAHRDKNSWEIRSDS